MPLSKKHIAFIEEYLSNGLVCSAAYRSVFKNVTVKSSETLGSRLLGKVEVKEEIAKRQAITAAKLDIKKDDLLKRLMDIAESQKDMMASTSVAAIKQASKMLGYDEPNKIEHSGSISFDLNLPGIDDEENDEEDLEDDED